MENKHFKESGENKLDCGFTASSAFNEENNKALGLGLTDSLIVKLGSLRQITVRPISAVAHMADAPQDALEIGKKLRVNARLLRTENGEQIWAERFEGEFTNIFDVEERLSERAAQALMIKLGGAKKKFWQSVIPIIQKRTTNMLKDGFSGIGERAAT